MSESQPQIRTETPTTGQEQSQFDRSSTPSAVKPMSDNHDKELIHKDSLPQYLGELLYTTKFKRPKYRSDGDAEKWDQLHFDQYKLFVEMMDRTSERRNGINSFFITANGAVLAVFSAIIGILGDTITTRNVWGFIGMSAILGIAGCFICGVWWRLLQSYRTLNGGKFEAINRMETMLPSRPYETEWISIHRKRTEIDPKPEIEPMIELPVSESSVNRLRPNFDVVEYLYADNKSRKDKYLSLSKVEQGIPRIFGWLYIVTAVVMIVASVIIAFIPISATPPEPETETIHVMIVTATPAPTLEVTSDTTAEATATATPP